MFINSQVGLLSPEKLADSAALAAGLSQALGSVRGIIGAAVSALSERHLAGVKTGRVIAALGSLAWPIATAFFAAAGAATNVMLQAVNQGFVWQPQINQVINQVSKIGRVTEEGLVDADAIAVLLNIPRDTVLDLARRQLIPSYRFSRKLIRFDKVEVFATADDKLKINSRRGRRPGDRYPLLQSQNPFEQTPLTQFL